MNFNPDVTWNTGSRRAIAAPQLQERRNRGRVNPRSTSDRRRSHRRRKTPRPPAEMNVFLAGFNTSWEAVYSKMTNGWVIMTMSPFVMTAILTEYIRIIKRRALVEDAKKQPPDPKSKA